MAGQFQSTLPRRERPTAHTPARSHGHFNPRSREGSDLLPGLTIEGSLAFQSTLPRRERHITSAAVAGLAHFNPRSREGSDTQVLRQALLCGISIHAPAKGATVVCRRVAMQHALFQSTLPRRERRRTRRCRSSWSSFQSTLPRRERRVKPQNCLTWRHFNPRSREGSDTFCGKFLVF